MSTTTADALVDQRIDQLLAEHPPASTPAQEFWGAQFDLGLAWVQFPEGHGGLGLSPKMQGVIDERLRAAGAPSPFGRNPIGIGMGAPTVESHGSEEQKQRYLRPLFTCEEIWCQLFSEPGAGSDVASLSTNAVRDGDEWVINGQKVFTSIADFADYVWLACRTDPEAKKHKGISIILVPTSAPGFKVTPIKIMGGAQTNATYYEDVRVPVTNLVGEVNRGWDLIVNQLNRERVALAPPGMCERQYAGVLEWARTTKLPDGRRVIDQEWVQLNLARVHAKLEYLKLINWKVAWGVDHGEVNVDESSATKVFGTEFFCEAYRLLLEVMGPAGSLKRGSPDALLRGGLERAYQGTLILTFGGGTNEIQRDLIAVFGLKMPRSL